jgi:phosphoenolpyruvate synthase/pyruvate phosphate dikinase
METRSRFDPRQAALVHAGMAERYASGRLSLDAPAIAELAHTVACGLVYVGDQVGRLVEHKSEEDRWREFLRDQAAQIPEGVESAAREILSQLEGRPLDSEMRDPIVQMVDWLNQLNNVRREVAR